MDQYLKPYGLYVLMLQIGSSDVAVSAYAEGIDLDEVTAPRMFIDFNASDKYLKGPLT